MSVSVKCADDKSGKCADDKSGKLWMGVLEKPSPQPWTQKK